MHKYQVYPGNYSELIKEALDKRENWKENEDDKHTIYMCNFIWRPNNFNIAGYFKLDSVAKSQPKNFVQIFNHFENIRGLCTKTGLVRSLKKYYGILPEAQKLKYGVFDSTPTTFLITSGVEDYEYALFQMRYREINGKDFRHENIPAKHCQNNFWLVKPANLNQGRGISLFKNLKEIVLFLRHKLPNTFWVVQKYIERPLLYRGRKFDIRVWALATWKNDVFMYKSAYIRTSSDSYDLNNGNNYVHLTNHCLQIYNENYGKHEDGNTLPLEALNDYFKELYPDKDITVEKHVIPRIKDLIIDTYLSNKKSLNPVKRKNVFELFGYDFIIDEDLRTWLLEVNTNPYLGTPNEFTKKLVPTMIDHMMDIIVDELLPPQKAPDAGENKFEIIYGEGNSKYSTQYLNQRGPINENIYPVPELAPPDYIKRVSALISEKHDNHHHQEISHNEASPTKIPDDKEEAQSLDPEKIKLEILENFYKELSNCLENKLTQTSSSYISKQLGRALSYLKNWEILSEKSVKLACKILKSVAGSGMNYMLAQQSNILILTELLSSHEVNTNIKYVVIEILIALTRDVELKKQIVCSKLLHDLMDLCVNSCTEKKMAYYDPKIGRGTLKCLEALSGIDNRKLYIPGETKEISKIRHFFISQGGIAFFWFISSNTMDEELKKLVSETLSNLTLKDLQTQLSACKILKNKVDDLNKSNLDTSKNHEDEAAAKRMIFYSSGDFEFLKKTLNANQPQEGEYFPPENEKNMSFPASVLSLKPWDSLISEFTQFIEETRDKTLQKERAEREKKLQAEEEYRREESNRLKVYEERRKAALENFEQRFKENQRIKQIEMFKKQQEQEQLRVLQMEYRKRNIEFLKSKKIARIHIQKGNKRKLVTLKRSFDGSTDVSPFSHQKTELPTQETRDRSFTNQRRSEDNPYHSYATPGKKVTNSLSNNPSAAKLDNVMNINDEMNVSFRTKIQAEKMIPRPHNNNFSVEKILPSPMREGLMNTRTIIEQKRMRKENFDDYVFTTEAQRTEKGKLPYIKYSERRDNPYLKNNPFVSPLIVRKKKTMANLTPIKVETEVQIQPGGSPILNVHNSPYFSPKS